MNHLEKGKLGEELAKEFLLKLDFEILAQNFTSNKYEIDLICKKKSILHFVEVKLRTTNRYGFPEQFVTAKKKSFLQAAAQSYIDSVAWMDDIQFDIIAVELLQNKAPVITFFEDI